jgi:hypothetical protein
MHYCIDLAVLGVPYNQPKLCPNVSWNPMATTFAYSIFGVTEPRHVLVDNDNTIIVGNRASKSILFWKNNSVNITDTINTNATTLNFFAITDDKTIWTQTTICGGSYFDQWHFNGTFIKAHSAPSMQRKYTSKLILPNHREKYAS